MNLQDELREHDDPRLYMEADVLMSQAADRIDNLEQKNAALLDALQHLVAELQRNRDGDYLLINDGTGLSRYTDIIAKATGQ